LAIDPALDADELKDVIWMLVEPDGIEPTTSSMPLSRTDMAQSIRSLLRTTKSLPNLRFWLIFISTDFPSSLFGGDVVAIFT
jgi:hypothetical protein